MRTLTIEPLLATLSEVCYQLSLDRVQLQKLIDSGEITCVTVLGKKLVIASTVESFIRRTRKAARAGVSS
jgi:predicted site-specific integrase-resolvase